MIKKIIITATAIAVLATSGIVAVAPRPARADTNSTIAAAAAIVGTLLFDPNNRPYYVNNGGRYYVSEPVANYYFQNHYGRWYSQHRNDWYHNRQQFARDWNNDYGNRGNHYGQGDDRGNGYGHDGHDHDNGHGNWNGN